MDFVQPRGDRLSALVTIASFSVATLYADEGQSKSSGQHEKTDIDKCHGRHTLNEASSTSPSGTITDARAARSTKERAGQKRAGQGNNKKIKTDFIQVTDIQDTTWSAQHLYTLPSSRIPSRETIRDFQIQTGKTGRKEIKTFKGTIISVGAFGDDGEPSKAKILYNDGECKTESIRKLHFLF